MNWRTLPFLTLVVLALPVESRTASAPCKPAGLDPEQLKSAYGERFQNIQQAQIANFLSEVPRCLQSLDPFFRDQVGYEGTASLLRRERVMSAEVTQAVRELRNTLLSAMDVATPDPDGVHKPFVIIVLAEIARTDRLSPWMTEAERLDLIVLASTYLNNLKDYRAFEEGVGFRHGVAHGADLILQLALNQQIPPDHLTPLVTAISAKISPNAGVPYTTGEPGRLGRALFYLMQRASPSTSLQTEIQTLVQRLEDPAPYASWSAAFASEKGLAFRHNRRAFVEALAVILYPHFEHELVKPYVEAIQTALKAVP